MMYFNSSVANEAVINRLTPNNVITPKGTPDNNKDPDDIDPDTDDVEPEEDIDDFIDEYDM